MSGEMSSGSIPSSSRGRLRLYLGVAPGAGKTYAMLAQGQRLAQRGVDVVVGLAETHSRTDTQGHAHHDRANPAPSASATAAQPSMNSTWTRCCPAVRSCYTAR